MRDSAVPPRETAAHKLFAISLVLASKSNGIQNPITLSVRSWTGIKKSTIFTCVSCNFTLPNAHGTTSKNTVLFNPDRKS